jgi:hypothetical protein
MTGTPHDSTQSTASSSSLIGFVLKFTIVLSVPERNPGKTRLLLFLTHLSPFHDARKEKINGIIPRRSARLPPVPLPSSTHSSAAAAPGHRQLTTFPIFSSP